jgi:hypothetical protein
MVEWKDLYVLAFLRDRIIYKCTYANSILHSRVF